MTERHSYMWQEENPAANIFETKSERFRRRLSLITINMVGFISTFGFSIVLTGAYPYLLQIDPDADKRVLGWVIAANPVGQLISSPLVGWLGNRFGSVRWLCMLTGVLNMIGFVLYACLGALPQQRRYWMIFARFIVGIAAGSVTLCITYISKATTSKERTTFISINALVSTIGFIVGPAVQSALIPLGQEGVHLGVGELRWNMYTSAGWLAASLTLISIILFLPCIFQEFNMAEKEIQWNKMMNLKTEEAQGLNSDATAGIVLPKSDMIGVFLCIFNFSIAGFILIMIETLATPITMDQLGYSDEEAVKKVGIVLSVGCILTILSFASSGPLAKKITERKALVLCGLVPLLLCHVVLLPYAGPTPLMQQSSFNNESDIVSSLNKTSAGNAFDNEPDATITFNDTNIFHDTSKKDSETTVSFNENDIVKDKLDIDKSDEPSQPTITENESNVVLDTLDNDSPDWNFEDFELNFDENLHIDTHTFSNNEPAFNNEIRKDTFSGDGSDGQLRLSQTVALALSISESDNSTLNLGCPIVQEWCRYTPAIHAGQLILGFMCIAIGYAFTATMSTSTMTQVLPPGQQGTWTGIYQAGGSLARILGPLYLTNVYTIYGPRATFGSIIVLLFLVIGLNLYLYKHLIPLGRRKQTK